MSLTQTDLSFPQTQPAPRAQRSLQTSRSSTARGRILVAVIAAAVIVAVGIAAFGMISGSSSTSSQPAVARPSVASVDPMWASLAMDPQGFAGAVDEYLAGQASSTGSASPGAQG